MFNCVAASPGWYGVRANVYEKESFPVIAWRVVDYTVTPIFVVEEFKDKWMVLIAPDGYTMTREGQGFNSWDAYRAWLKRTTGSHDLVQA